MQEMEYFKNILEENIPLRYKNRFQLREHKFNVKCRNYRYSSNPCHFNIDGIADSGAKSDVWGLDEYRKAGYLQQELCTMNYLNAANKSATRIDGAFFTTISGKTDGRTKSMV